MKYVIDDTTLKEIANSIRAKTGLSSDITPENMPQLIDGIVGSEDLNDLLNTQEQLIAELKEELQDKASGGGSGITGELVVYGEIERLEGVTFSENELLTDVHLPNATYIGDRGFFRCKNLKSVHIPKVTQIGNDAFTSCSSLASVNSPEVTFIGNSAFSACSSLTSVNFPNVEKIGDGAFANCVTLSNAYVPWVTVLGEGAFRTCEALTSVDCTILEWCGIEAFMHCLSLKSARLGDADIGASAFYNCNSLEYVESGALTIGASAFYNCNSLTTINPYMVQHIGAEAFMWCSSLATVELPRVIDIGSSAFLGCYALDTLILGNTEEVCNLDATAILDTKIATAEGVPTGEGFIYVPSIFYEQYVTNIAEQIYMLLIYTGYSEEEAAYMAPYIAMAVLRTIEDTEQASTFGLRNPLANFKGFTKEAIEQFKQMRNRE